MPTERKRSEEELKRLNSDLKRQTVLLEEANIELEHRKIEAEESRLQAEAANRAKSEFLSNMSHELRTPLNSIIGFSDAMLKGLAGRLSEEQLQYLKYIYESGDHLLSLINDVLDLSKIEAGKMGLEPSEGRVNDLIDGCLMMFREKAMAHRIQLSSDVRGNIAFVADVRKVKQVLFNLLSNAMKFTPDGGRVLVTARRVRQEDAGADLLEISVSDTGIGISPEDQKRLFVPFQQIETTYTKKYAGTGLGLSLCKRFVELHGGSIRVESRQGMGAKFVFTIPLKAGFSGR